MGMRRRSRSRIRPESLPLGRRVKVKIFASNSLDCMHVPRFRGSIAPYTGCRNPQPLGYPPRIGLDWIGAPFLRC